MLLKLAVAGGVSFEDELCFHSPCGTKSLQKEAGGDGDEIPLRRDERSFNFTVSPSPCPVDSSKGGLATGMSWGSETLCLSAK